MQENMEKSKKVFLIFTAAFLGCVLLVGIVLGTISIVRNSLAVMKYKGVYLNEGVANYLTASYKYDFMSALNRSGIECYDTESFWQRDAGEGKTYGEILKENTEKYLRSVLVGSYLFDRNTRLNKNDKATIEKSISEVVEYKAYGDVDRFNELAEPMGFDYRDFVKAAKLLYKAEMAESVIFGFDGSALASGGFTSECEEYFRSSYSKVRLMIIRTDGELVTDSETGRQELLPYTDAERDAVLSKIETIRERITSGQKNEDAFIWHIENEYPTGTVNDQTGYYFSATSAYSQNFAKEGAPEVVKKALSMKVGEYGECEVDVGVCFIYKCELDPGAYSGYTVSHFFEDFYANAAPYIYNKSVEIYISDVKVKEKYNADNVITQPCRTQEDGMDLQINFG